MKRVFKTNKRDYIYNIIRDLPIGKKFESLEILTIVNSGTYYKYTSQEVARFTHSCPWCTTVIPRYGCKRCVFERIPTPICKDCQIALISLGKYGYRCSECKMKYSEEVVKYG